MTTGIFFSFLMAISRQPSAISKEVFGVQNPLLPDSHSQILLNADFLGSRDWRSFLRMVYIFHQCCAFSSAMYLFAFMCY